jgi:hypothetical protein
MTMRRGPPAWADALVSLVVDADDRENVPGDLFEEYHESILPAVGRTRAGLWYLRRCGRRESKSAFKTAHRIRSNGAAPTLNARSCNQLQLEQPCHSKAMDTLGVHQSVYKFGLCVPI